MIPPTDPTSTSSTIQTSLENPSALGSRQPRTTSVYKGKKKNLTVSPTDPNTNVLAAQLSPRATTPKEKSMSSITALKQRKHQILRALTTLKMPYLDKQVMGRKFPRRTKKKECCSNNKR